MSTYYNNRNGNRSGSRNRGRSRRRVRPRYDRIIGAAAIFIVLMIILVSCCKSCGGSDEKSDASSIVPTEKSESAVDSGASADESSVASLEGYSTVTEIPNAVYEGDLLLVNKDHAYSFPPSAEENIKTIYDNGSDSYQFADYETSLASQALTALNTMMDKFYEEKGISDCMVISGFRTKEYQDEIHNSGTTDIPGGNSDYHTGLTFDLGVYPDGGSSYYYDGNGDYSWIGENCAKYGFIIRYPEGKNDATGIESRAYTFRYVGIPHAVCMAENSLCLEEYIEFIKNYTYDGDHLKVSGPDKNYEIYYVAANPSADTDVPVPPDKTYTISGNNVDGFIVTVELS